MIRNVVLGRLRPGVEREQVEPALAAIVDVDDEHNRIRSEMFGPLCSDIARVQFNA